MSFTDVWDDFESRNKSWLKNRANVIDTEDVYTLAKEFYNAGREVGQREGAIAERETWKTTVAKEMSKP